MKVYEGKRYKAVLQKWAILVIGLTMLALCVSAWKQHRDELGTDTVIRVDDRIYEQVIVHERNGQILVHNLPVIDNLSGLAGYWWLTQGRLEAIKKNDHTVFQAQVTFRSNLDQAEMERALGSVGIKRVRFGYGVDHGGELGYPFTEETLALFLEEVRDNDPSFPETAKPYFVAASVSGEAAEIQMLAGRADVFAVDVGATEYRSEFTGARFYTIRDVAYDYRKQVLPYCNIDALTSLLAGQKDQGLVTDPAVYQSLQSKLQMVARLIQKGKNPAAKNMLDAFGMEVRAQADKHIEKLAAGELIMVGQCIAYSLPSK